MLRHFTARVLSARRGGLADCVAGGAARLCRETDGLVPLQGAEAIRGMHAQPQAEENDEEEKRDVGSPRVHKLVEEILQLNLLEIADLTTLLKGRLNLTDTPMFAGMPVQQAQAAQPAAPVAGEAKEEKKEEEKKEFDVKLEGFDAASKIKVIKEIRGITELGLKQAKELVEKAPQVIKSSVDKKTAEELKKKLESVGAKVSLS